MNFPSYNSLCRYLKDDDITLDFSVKNGLVKKTETCDCGGKLAWIKNAKQKFGYMFQCTKSNCKRRYSLLHGSWFANSKLPMNDQILLVYSYCMDMKSKQLGGMFGIAKNTVADWQNFRFKCDIVAPLHFKIN